MTDVVGWMREMLGMFEIPHDTCLIGKIQALCLDETPMVKRAAASHLGKYAASIKDKDLLKTEILDMCMSLAKDDQDSVRLLGVENFTQLGKMFTEEKFATSFSYNLGGGVGIMTVLLIAALLGFAAKSAGVL